MKTLKKLLKAFIIAFLSAVIIMAVMYPINGTALQLPVFSGILSGLAYIFYSEK